MPEQTYKCGSCRFSSYHNGTGQSCNDFRKMPFGDCTNYNKWEPVPTAPLDVTGQIYGNGEVTTDGLKYDAQKVDMSFLEYFPLALEKICALSEVGAKKYSRGGFRGITDPKRCKAAMLRHYFKEGLEDTDPDSGFEHDVAVAWNALAALEIRLMNDRKTDPA